MTPLIVAALYNEASAVSTLLTLGADPTVRDADNKTALDIGRGENSTEVVRVLQEWGKCVTVLYFQTSILPVIKLISLYQVLVFKAFCQPLNYLSLITTLHHFVN